MSKKILVEIDQHIRQSQISLARKKLSSIPLGKWNEIDSVFYANLARRCGLTLRGLKMIKPYIEILDYGQLKGDISAVKTYAAGLTNLHLLDESNKILSVLNISNDPELNLFKGLNAVARWDYEQAKDHFYLAYRHFQVSYSRCVAFVNYISCLIFLNEYEEAMSAAFSVLSECKQNKWFLLYSNISEMLGQCYFFMNQISESKKWFSESYNYTEKENVNSKIILNKWKLVLDLKENNKMNVQEWNQLKQMAVQNNLWEINRDLDFFELLYQFNKEKYEHLFLGTTYISYKNRIRKAFKNQFNLSKDFELDISNLVYSSRLIKKNVDHQKTISFENDIAKKINYHEKYLKIIQVLLQDFYRPASLGILYSEVYHKECFDPIHGYNKILKLIQRFKEEIRNKIPFELQIFQSNNHFHLGGNLRLRFKTEYFNAGTTRQKLIYPNKEYFNINDIKELNPVHSVRNLQRILNTELRSSKINRIGKSSATIYKLAG